MQLLKFYKTSIEEFNLEIKSLIQTGSKRFLLVQEDGETHNLVKSLTNDEKLTFHIQRDIDTSSFQGKKSEYDVIILTEDKDLNSLSKQLLSCLDLERGVVMAPLTDNYFMERPFFLMTIPKSGTHMLTSMFSHLDIQRNYSHIPVPGKYSTLEHYTYHAPCKEFMLREWPDPVGRHPFFRSPAIFVYRNPLDIIASEFSWYKKPDIAFSHYLKTFDDSDEKLMHLIDDPLVMGTIRDRMNMYIGWLDFSNVIPISYEEIVGANGGGSDIEQTKTIWSLQLKLHIPGNPVELAKTLYNNKSPTFNKGNIGRHIKLFKEMHYKRFKALPQDFMEKMGYDIDKIGVPKYIDYYRKRPLEYWQPTEKELWEQRLIKENYIGYNIVATAGQYVAVSGERGTLDLSIKANRNKDGVHLGFESLEETTQFIKQNFFLHKPQLLDSYQNYNLIGYKDNIYAVWQGFDLDLTEIGKGKIKEYQAEKKLFVADTIDAVKKTVDQKGIVVPELLKSYHGFNLIRYNDVFYAILKGIDFDLMVIEKTKIKKYQNKKWLFTANSFDAVKKAVDQKDISTPSLLESYQDYNLIGYKDSIYAVWQGFDLDLTDIGKGEIKEHQAEKKLFVADTIDAAKKAVEQKGIAIPKLLGSYQDYNLIRYKDCIYAVWQGFDLDLTEIGENEIKEYQAEKKLFVADTIDAAKEAVDQKGIAIPKLLESYQDFNLVRYKSRIYAVLKGIDLDLTKARESILNKYQEGNELFIANSIDETKDFIRQRG